jgi:hypothetical protein
MDGGSTKTTQNTNSEPWPAAQPVLKQGLNDAQGIYNNGQSFQPYMGSTVVPFSEQTQQGIRGTLDRASSSQNALDRNFNRIDANAQNNGLNATQQGVEQRLTDMARNPFNVNDNPAFQNVLKQATDSAGQAVDMGASAYGRYGSGIHQGNVAREVGNVAGNLTNNEYNDWKNRRDAANASLFNIGQQQQNNILSNSDALATAYGYQQQPNRDLMNVGSMYEDLAGRTLNDKLRIWQGQQDAPKNALQWLQAIGSGAGSLGGTGSTTAQGPSASPFGQVLGGLLGANSLFG